MEHNLKSECAKGMQGAMKKWSENMTKSSSHAYKYRKPKPVTDFRWYVDIADHTGPTIEVPNTVTTIALNPPEPAPVKKRGPRKKRPKKVRDDTPMDGRHLVKRKIQRAPEG